MACRDDPRIAAAKALTEARFPRYWQELQGLAAGLALPFDDVFAWNSRGDVWALATDGCTTVLLPGAQPEQPRPVPAHNHAAHTHIRKASSRHIVSPTLHVCASYLYMKKKQK